MAASFTHADHLDHRGDNDDNLSPEEAKERKIMRLLLKARPAGAALGPRRWWRKGEAIMCRQVQIGIINSYIEPESYFIYYR